MNNKPRATGAAAFREMLETLNLSRAGAAHLLHVHDRTVRRWVDGAVPIPRAVMIVLHLMIMQQLSSDHIARPAKSRAADTKSCAPTTSSTTPRTAGSPTR